jgi:CRISPR-associated endonuclease Cas3-HD
MALYAWCNHDLETHLRNTATLVMCPNELKNQKPYEKVDLEKLARETTTVINRLSAITETSAKSVRTALTISAYLHDIGKALSDYQEEFEKCGNKENEISLKGHEAWSAWVTYHVFQGLRTFNILNVDPTPYVIGVALHHSARRSIIDAIIQARAYPKHNDIEGIIKTLRHIEEVCRGALKVDFEFYDHVETALKYDVETSIRRAIDDIIQNLMNKPTGKYGELVTYVISIADNIDSWIYRKGFTPIIIKKFTKD